MWVKSSGHAACMGLQSCLLTMSEQCNCSREPHDLSYLCDNAAALSRRRLTILHAHEIINTLTYLSAGMQARL